jgi:hypothetical protein
MQQGGGAKLSTTLFTVFAILLFVGVTTLTLLGPSDPIGGGRVAGSQGTVKVTTEDGEWRYGAAILHSYIRICIYVCIGMQMPSCRPALYCVLLSTSQCSQRLPLQWHCCERKK